MNKVIETAYGRRQHLVDPEARLRVGRVVTSRVSYCGRFGVPREPRGLATCKSCQLVKAAR